MWYVIGLMEMFRRVEHVTETHIVHTLVVLSSNLQQPLDNRPTTARQPLDSRLDNHLFLWDIGKTRISEN